MDNKILDNLSGQEIREMIISGAVKLNELSTQALETLFDYESDRVSDGASDASLLLECAEILDNANHGEEAAQKSQAFLKSVLDEMCAEKPPKKQKKRRWKTAAIIAAAVLLFAFGITALADTMGYDILSYLREMVGMEPGTVTEKDGVTLVHIGETKDYSSVEELLRDENLNIMYPSVLPDGITLEEVRVVDSETGGSRIQFIMNTSDITINVDTSAEMQVDFPYYESHYEKHTSGNHDFYLFEEERHFAICHENETYYSIGAADKETLIFIINHMKEYGS